MQPRSASTPMHAGEVMVDEGLVRRLLAGQFPRWAALPVSRVPSSGTDNALFRLGGKMVVRVPRIHWAAGDVEKEQRWLPILAPGLPLATPEPLAMGAPAEDYPYHWSIYRWLEGERVSRVFPADRMRAATDLAHFILTLQSLDPAGGPLPGGDNSDRGAPLVGRDTAVRAALAQLEGGIDTAATAAAWEESLAAPIWEGAGVWVHGDLQEGNLLARDDRLSAVIDFGCLGVGDPACDLMPAWTLFSGESRSAFRAALAVDEATWLRGRGWALSVALIALPYYRHTNPAIVAHARHAIREVLAEHALD